MSQRNKPIQNGGSRGGGLTLRHGLIVSLDPALGPIPEQLYRCVKENKQLLQAPLPKVLHGMGGPSQCLGSLWGYKSENHRWCKHGVRGVGMQDTQRQVALHLCSPMGKAPDR